MRIVMNFGNSGLLEVIFAVLVWLIPVVLLGWFVRTLSSISASLREIAERLGSVEGAIRDVSIPPGQSRV
jgi:hypothetical protein